MEDLVHRIIVHLSGAKEEKITPFMANLMLEGKLTILENLANRTLRSRKAKTEFAAALIAIRRANTGRISLIHGVWQVPNFLALIAGTAKPDGKAIARNMKKPASPPVSAAKAESIAIEIAEAFETLNSFWLTHWFRPTLRRAKSRAKSLARRQSQQNTRLGA